MKKNRNYTIVGIGEILWDILPEGKKLGGAPANFSYHAKELGTNGIIVSCVGDDDLGKEIIDNLEELGLTDEYLSVNRDYPTGTVSVKLDEERKPEYTIHENVAWDFIPLKSKLIDLANTADAVGFGTLAQRSKLSRNTIRDFLNATKSNCIHVFDINLRQSYYNKEIIEDLLTITDLLRLNDEELPELAEMFDLKGKESDQLSELLGKFSLQLITLTKGERGSRLYNGKEDSRHHGYSIDVVDTVGAGDAFTAAVTLGFLKGIPLDEVNDYANKTAAFVCSKKGATPELSASLKSEIEALIYS